MDILSENPIPKFFFDLHVHSKNKLMDILSANPISNFFRFFLFKKIIFDVTDLSVHLKSNFFKRK